MPHRALEAIGQLSQNGNTAEGPPLRKWGGQPRTTAKARCALMKVKPTAPSGHRHSAGSVCHYGAGAARQAAHWVPEGACSPPCSLTGQGGQAGANLALSRTRSKDSS